MSEFPDDDPRSMLNPSVFALHAGGRKLRAYQEQVTAAIIKSVRFSQGLSFVVIFPRQSGKNELQAQIETYLLSMLEEGGGEMVKVSPTWKPQALNAMHRLQSTLKRNILTRHKWRKESGHIYRVRAARITFLSGAPTANIVGATASLLLEVDEAQDISIAKFDIEIAPMAASTNATRVFWGTAWTSRTLLARELRTAQEAERKDGIRRAWVLSADDVAAEVPTYGNFVAEQIRKLGRNHPSVKTQFFSEEIDAESGMFPPERIALMAGSHRRQKEPQPGAIYALLIDVAGEDEAAIDDPYGIYPASQADSGSGSLANPRRDSTTATVVQIDLATLADPLIKAPTFRVVRRQVWTGTKHSRLYGILRTVAELWRARYIVIDATGVGAGLASFLGKAFPGRVIPYTFNSSTKSKLGYAFLAVVETGRFKDYVELDPERATFNLQLASCQLVALDGPQHFIKWGVPDGARDPDTGALVHDDLILSAALCAALDELPWSSGGAPLVIQAADPLASIDKERF